MPVSIAIIQSRRRRRCIQSERSRKMWHVSSSDGWHVPPARELDGWPTGYIRETALELRSSSSLWFVRLNTWWDFSSHDVLPPLNSIVESFYVSVRVDFPARRCVCSFCAVTSSRLLSLSKIPTAEEVEHWRMLCATEYSLTLNVSRFRSGKVFSVQAISVWVFSFKWRSKLLQGVKINK